MILTPVITVTKYSKKALLEYLVEEFSNLPEN